MSELGKQARAASGVAVGAYQVFFIDETFAKRCAEKYGAKLEQLDDGWLVTKTVIQSSGDDPITQSIRNAIKEAGLSLN